MHHNRLTRVMKQYSPTGKRKKADLWKDFWTRETGTGQQVAQLHDRYDEDEYTNCKLGKFKQRSDFGR
jgi:hypothetical protein